MFWRVPRKSEDYFFKRLHHRSMTASRSNIRKWWCMM